ncbi:MAG: DUF4258 domain-containing protein [Pseudomonadota bacterium]
MSIVKRIRSLVSHGLYYLTEHAYDEADADDFDVYDVEQGIATGKIRRTWPKESKYELIGSALDGRTIGAVCRITSSGKVCIITVYEDKPTE